MNVLVIGAGGMVGSHMVELLHSHGESVIGTYYLPTTDIKELLREIKMIECDVRYPASVEKIIMKYKPEQIHHLAAQSYLTVWPYETIKTNVNGTIVVFEAVKSVRNLIDKKYDPTVVVACSSIETAASLWSQQSWSGYSCFSIL